MCLKYTWCRNCSHWSPTSTPTSVILVLSQAARNGWWRRNRNTKIFTSHSPMEMVLLRAEPPYVHWCSRHGRHEGSWPYHTPTPRHLPTTSGRFPRTLQRLAIQQVHVRRAHPRSGPHLSARLPLSARIPWDLRLHTTQSLPGALQAGYVLSGAVGCHTNRGEGGTSGNIASIINKEWQGWLGWNTGSSGAVWLTLVPTAIEDPALFWNSWKWFEVVWLMIFILLFRAFASNLSYFFVHF